MLGGRAAEELIFGSISTGASNDLERATNIARAMIAYYGMSDKFGNVQFMSVESRYLDGRTVMNCADKTAAEVDKEVMAMIKDCYKEAYKMLKKNRDIMDKLAAHLIEKETITGREFMEIYCHEKGIPVPPPKDNALQFGRDNKDSEGTASSDNANGNTSEIKDYYGANNGAGNSAENNSSDQKEYKGLSGFVQKHILNDIDDDDDEDAYFSEDNTETEEKSDENGKDDSEINDLLQIINEEEKNGSNAENDSQNAEGNNTGSSENISEDEEFMDILKKRAEGKNDEVE